MPIALAADFVDELRKVLPVSAVEAHILRSSGVRSYDDLHSLLRNFPSVRHTGLRLPALARVALDRIDPDFAAVAHSRQPRPRLHHGAAHPAGAVWKPGARVPAFPPAATPPMAPPAGGAIDLRVPNWPIRDQADRETCIAFASAACAERVSYNPGTGGPTILSPQFLYSVIKTQTQDRLVDAGQETTFLQFARDALRDFGICSEQTWPYVPTLASYLLPTGGTPPSEAAVAAAAANRFPPQNYQQPQGQPGVADQIIASLQANRPVAVSLPMFSDPEQKGETNWTNASATLYGHVMNPPATSESQSDAHAVCIVGFVPTSDSTEPRGYFIFRNSWGTSWASRAPSTSGYAPEPGYGDLSASYVDQYLLEMLEI